MKQSIKKLCVSLQVIAFTCCVITTFLMVAATANSEWIKSEGWREGLFEQCVRAGAPMPMPFGGLPIPGCRRAHDAGTFALRPQRVGKIGGPQVA